MRPCQSFVEASLSRDLALDLVWESHGNAPLDSVSPGTESDLGLVLSVTALDLHDRPLDERDAHCSAECCSSLLQELVLSFSRLEESRRARHQGLRSTLQHVSSV